MKSKLLASVLGFAVADALGVPVEFMSREDLLRAPVTEMMGYLAYPVPEGSFSDDTSMVLATMDSLLSGKIDYTDIMEKFSEWRYDGKYCPDGKLFDIGNICRYAIHRYKKEGIEPCLCGASDEYSNGNGALMRIIPFCFFLLCHKEYDACKVLSDATSLTHRHERSILASLIYYEIISAVVDSPSVESIKRALYLCQKKFSANSEISFYKRLLSVDFDKTPISEIKSTGYVVDTIEAAIWCVLTTNDYKSCVLKAVNLGEDTDTVAAIAGGIAGIIYGIEAIPEAWVNTLKRKDYIISLTKEFAEAVL